MIGVCLIASILFIYHYFTFVPYFNSFTSIVYGSVICNYFWICVNALLMMILNIYGHIIIICIGIPVIIGVVYNMRQIRIQHILLSTIEKTNTPIEALSQIIVIQQLIKSASFNRSVNVSLIGIVNLHVLECQNSDCPCKNDVELFDINTGNFSKHTGSHHKDFVFLNYFNKKLYEDFLSKFTNSPQLHIGFSNFLFEIMKNIHASLLELDMAYKKKPTLKQEFMIFRQRSDIENYIITESMESKDIYMKLTNIVEFESLLDSCQKSIEKVASYQIEFWTQVGNQLPDLNILHELVNKIYGANIQVDNYWNSLCNINSSYSKALTLYGNYIIELKNHNQLGIELLDK